MGIQRRVRGPVLVAMAVAVLAAILSLVFGYSGNLTAMTFLTVLVVLAVAVAAILAFRAPPAGERRS
jgi:peptidoglycan/LPS O-acetylase OafA/YrhL